MHALGRIGVTVAVLVAAVLVLAPSAAAGESDAAEPAGTLTLAGPTKTVTFGHKVTVTGTIEPAAEGIEILIERASSSGEPLAVTTTGAGGTFTAALKLKRSESLQASAPAIGLTSGAVEVEVAPRVTLWVTNVPALADATVRIRAKPATTKGVATITVKRGGRVVETTTTRVHNGRATGTVAAAGPGAYTVAVEFDPAGRLVAGRASTRAKTSIRDLSVGSKGGDVAGLIRRLGQLNIHVPSRSLTFSDSLRHSVIAFQKVVGLPRTGVMTQPDWQMLATAKPVKATQAGPANRIEIDKTRQILIKVIEGKVAGVLPVSSGRTGNTPEGVQQIRWKALSSTTWLGPGILYRPLTFVDPTFAIHGWADVPAYPASAGCVRIPIWTADWLYNRSPVGETIIVHR